MILILIKVGFVDAGEETRQKVNPNRYCLQASGHVSVSRLLSPLSPAQGEQTLSKRYIAAGQGFDRERFPWIRTTAAES